MGSRGRLVAIGMVVCMVGAFAWVALAGLGGGRSGRRSELASTGTLTRAGVPAQSEAPGVSLGSLVVPAMEAFDGGQSSAAAQVRRTSSAAILARERSLIEFAHLGAARAERVARTAFPSLIEQRDGGTPALGAGQRIARYLSPTIAQLELPGGKRAVIESLAAMARPAGHGHFTPIDLALTDTGSSYVPVATGHAVRIPKQLSEGVRTPEGVSLTPSEASGAPLTGAQGALDGASVIYANTQTDADTVAKPTSRGFEISTILRSADSPRRLYYKVGLPSGASLLAQQQQHGVQIVSDGVVIATVMPPSAIDASGTQVPVKTSVEGGLLALEVGDDAGEYQWPIAVDPEVTTTEDRSLTGAVFPIEMYKGGTNWKPVASGMVEEKEGAEIQYGAFHFNKNYSCSPFETYWCEQSWYIEPRSAYGPEQYAGILYQTQGESKAYKLEAWLEGENEPSQTATKIQFYNHAGKLEDNQIVSEGEHQGRYEAKPATLCAEGQLCSPSVPGAGNYAQIMDFTTKSESSYGFWTWITDARIYVSQEKGPTASFNTSSSTIAEAENRPNVLYGSGSWLSPSQGAYEVKDKDPGIGVSFAAISGAGMSQMRFIQEREGKCKGIQCAESYEKAATYLPTMANGEDSIESFAENAAGMSGYEVKTIKVDAAKPYNLGFTGMPETGAEISAAPHKFTFHATDGTKPTPSSGVKSIAVSIDGSSATLLPGSNCSLGECTASGTYTLHAEGLTEGVHRLTVTAIDNAGNEAAKVFLFDVRHADPVPVGPGTVDPTTGQLTLNAQDVSLGGASGVSRTYQSRSMTAGTGSAFGPQWALSVGGGEGLTVLPSGSVDLIASSSGLTTFSLNGEGKFESPVGDENLKMEYKATEHKYVLSNSTAGTETVFEQPTGTEKTTPAIANHFGSEGSQLHPAGVAIDPSGNVWVADYLNDRILKYSPAGTLLAAYGSYGHWEGNFIDPRALAINPSTKNVYVTDEGNNRVVELNEKGEFIETFGWGVTNGAAEFQICKSGSYCEAGTAGAGAGQFSAVKGLAVDASGNVWVVDSGNNRIEEFAENGEFKQQFGTTGTGEAQFKQPIGIAVDGGNLYVSECENNRVQELSTIGKYIKQFGKAGSGKGEFNCPRDIAVDPTSGNLYVADWGNGRIQEFTSTGALITMFGSSGSGEEQFSEPKGVAVNGSGWIYVADYNNNRMAEWARSKWWPTSAKGALSTSTGTTYVYQAVEGHEGSTSIEPSEVLAPAPAGVTCGTKVEELKQGCRALTLVYATTTSAWEVESAGWGSYKGRIAQVKAHLWNPATKAMAEPVVAEYLYDASGRLRAEWDPRISPALKTTYGYDENTEVVTGLTRPGQQGWVFTYGTIEGDSNTGRLLKATQAQPKAGASEAEVEATLREQSKRPQKSEAPKLSGSPAAGSLMSVSQGTWSNHPVSYGYQWEDCNASGKECVPILGATNANYLVTASDLGHTLVAQVNAMNGGGSVTAATAASTEVKGAEGEYSLPASSGPSSIVAGPDGNLWFTNFGTNKLGKITTSGTVTEYAPSGAYATGIAVGSDKNLWLTLSLGGTIGKATTSGVITEYSLGAGNYPREITPGPDGNLWFTVEGTNEIGKITTAGVPKMYALPAKSKPYGIVAGPEKENLWFTESESNKIGKITTTASITEYALPAGSNPSGITAGPDGNLWYTDAGTNKIGKITTAGVKTEYALPAGSYPQGITVGPEENLWFTEQTANKLGKITTSGTITEYALPSGSQPKAIVTGPDKKIWFTDYGSNKIGKFNPTQATFSEPNPQPGWTLEYHIPVSGTGLPNLTKEAVEKWGQKDISEAEDNDPVEGMALFPPNEPQGWPASSYKRATIDYLNEKGLTVNVSSPSDAEAEYGSISTAEYNETNETIRTLSADNRAAALAEGCISVAKKECKSAEVSELLDTKTEYNPEGSEVLETVGPQHKVKLAKGAEVQAREISHDYYNEGAKEVEEKTHESYRLLTKTISGALLAGGEEKDERTTKTSYSGQENLGWKLRKPTSTTIDPGGLNITTTTIYDSTGNVVETRAPAGSNSGSAVAPVVESHFGSEGTGNGQFNHPESVAVDASGNLWVDDKDNGRLQKFSATGQFIAAYGSKGSGSSQFSNAWGIAINKSSGNVYVADMLNNRIEELNSAGAFVRVFGFGVSNGEEKFQNCTTSCRAGIAGTGTGQMKEPRGVEVDASGNVWVADFGNNRIEEFTASGEFIKAFGSKGSGNGQLNEPGELAFSEGALYVTDQANERVEEFSTAGAYLGQFGTKGAGAGQFEKPWGIAADPVSGDLYVVDSVEKGRVEEFNARGVFVGEFGYGVLAAPTGVTVNTAGEIYVTEQYAAEVSTWTPVPKTPVFSSQFGSHGSGSGQFVEPRGAAVTKSGNIDVLDAGNARVEEFSASGTYLQSFGSLGKEKGQMSAPSGMAGDAKGNVWIADSSNNRVDEFNEKREFVQAFGWGVSNGEAKLQVCTITCKAGLSGSGSGQFKELKSIAVTPTGAVYTVDVPNNRVQEFTEKGEFVAAFGFGVSNGESKFEICTTTCQAGVAGTGAGQFKEPGGIGVAPNGAVWVADTGNNRIQEFNEKHEFVLQFGSNGTGNGQFKGPKDVKADAAGKLWVVDTVNNRVQEFTSSGTFLASFGDAGTGPGQFEQTRGMAITSTGTMYVADYNNSRVQIWTPSPRPGNEGAHDTHVVYYTAKAEAEVAACQNHPEWAGLPCQTAPVAQVGTGVTPELPTTTVTYNMWDEVETSVEKFGSAAESPTRTMTQTYDEAGRSLTSQETSTLEEVLPKVIKALPKVTIEYNAKTGAVEKQSTTTEGKTKTITSTANTLGQLIKYTDAAGAVSTYVYENGGDDRLTEFSSEGPEGEVERKKGSQKYSYDTTTGSMTELVDSAAKTFTATYDVEDRMLTEHYPDGLTAKYSYDSTGKATGIEYVKSAHCATTCPETWFSDKVTSTIHGEAAVQSSTLAKESYVYDAAGRLTEAQETPTGKGCKARLYAYDEEENRTSEISRESATETCASEGGVIEAHSYDSANRLIDAGVTYEALGNVTKLPAVDAGGHELTSTYYVDGQIATQEQNGPAMSYVYDPAGRAVEATVSGKTETFHYGGSGEALTWTSEEEGKKSARNIPGIDGGLDAIQTNGGTPVLQLHDLEGNIVAAAALSETETKLLSSYNSSEFGVPTTSSAPAYSWLGAGDVSSALPASGVVTQGGASYVPEIARDLQTAPVVPPGAFPNGPGPGTQYTATVSAAALAAAQEEATKTWQEAEAARQKAREEEAMKQLAVGGEGEDPAELLTWQDAIKLAETFEEWARADGNGIEAATEVMGNNGPMAIVSYDIELLIRAAHELRGCAAKVKGEHPKGECWVRYSHKTVNVPAFGGPLDLVTQFEGSACSWVSGHKAHHETFLCSTRRGEPLFEEG